MICRHSSNYTFKLPRRLRYSQLLAVQLWMIHTVSDSTDRPAFKNSLLYRFPLTSCDPSSWVTQLIQSDERML